MNEINDRVGSASTEESLMLSPVGVSYLLETAKWTKFLSILGFIGMGFMVIGGLFASVAMSRFGGSQSLLIGVMYIVMAAIYFFPILYLYKFSNDLKEALNRNNSSQLELALGNLKSHYKFIGILTIVLLGIYLLVFLFAGAAASIM